VCKGCLLNEALVNKKWNSRIPSSTETHAHPQNQHFTSFLDSIHLSKVCGQKSAGKPENRYFSCAMIGLHLTTVSSTIAGSTVYRHVNLVVYYMSSQKSTQFPKDSQLTGSTKKLTNSRLPNLEFPRPHHQN
jgi:hypothetical protein